MTRIRIYDFFDYVYFLSASMHKHITGIASPYKISGIFYLTILQFMNMISLLEYFGVIDKLPSIAPIIQYGVLLLGLFAFNLFRYFEVCPYEDFEQRWGNDNRNWKIVKIIAVSIYILVSFIIVTQLSHLTMPTSAVY